MTIARETADAINAVVLDTTPEPPYDPTKPRSDQVTRNEKLSAMTHNLCTFFGRGRPETLVDLVSNKGPRFVYTGNIILTPDEVATLMEEREKLRTAIDKLTGR